MKLIRGEPRNSAAYVVAGCSYSSAGAPSCSMRPSRMRMTRVPIVMASVWSWVT
ncbi:Uncharacterised protein [Bordetella pertussis]|nr:Uncharacterised protein [Bordetella pertussis]CPM14014.1 Uncharacterised protein [Bordetella pertussis]